MSVLEGPGGTTAVNRTTTYSFLRGPAWIDGGRLARAVTDEEVEAALHDTEPLVPTREANLEISATVSLDWWAAFSEWFA